MINKICRCIAKCKRIPVLGLGMSHLLLSEF